MNTETAAKLLDVERMGPILGELPALVADCVATPELVALWVKPGRYFNAHYRVARNGQDGLRVSAFVVEPGRGARVVSAAGAHTCTNGAREACRRCSTWLAAPDLLLQVFPWDHRLPNLRRCIDVRRVRRALPALAVESCEVVAYRPGMRCQIRYQAAQDASVFGKVSVEKRGRGYSFLTQRAICRAITNRTRELRLPEPLAYVDELGLTMVAGVGGRSLHEILEAGAPAQAEVRCAARAIAELHRLEPIVKDRVYAADDELDVVKKWSAVVGALSQDLALALAESELRLARTLPGTARPMAVLHRDFHDKQILFDEGGSPILLDLDTAAMGDPELDLANFCAHLHLRGIQNNRVEECRRLADWFVEEYPRPIEDKRFDWYRRASLVRLACNYALRPRWRHIARDVLAAALED